MSHPTHYIEVIQSLHGIPIKLTGAVFMEAWDKSPQVDVWGRIGDEGPIYPPRDPDKSIAKHGGVEGYKKSPARKLFHHISLGQYLSFSLRAIRHFQVIPNSQVGVGNHRNDQALPKRTRSILDYPAAN